MHHARHDQLGAIQKLRVLDALLAASYESSSPRKLSCSVGPKDASWPMHSYGTTTMGTQLCERLKLAQFLGQLGVFLTFGREADDGGQAGQLLRGIAHRDARAQQVQRRPDLSHGP